MGLFACKIRGWKKVYEHFFSIAVLATVFNMLSLTFPFVSLILLL